MDPVLEQIIKAIEPMDLAKAAECYQRLASLTIRQDSKLSYLAGRIAGVQQTLHPETLQKPLQSLLPTMPSTAGKIRPRARPVRPML